MKPERIVPELAELQEKVDTLAEELKVLRKEQRDRERAASTARQAADRLRSRLSTTERRRHMLSQYANLLEKVAVQGSVGIVDRRDEYKVTREFPRIKGTYWRDYYGYHPYAYKALPPEGVNGKMLEFVRGNSDRHYATVEQAAAAAKRYATDGTYVPPRKIVEQGVDVDALNKALAATGYRVVKDG